RFADCPRTSIKPPASSIKGHPASGAEACRMLLDARCRLRYASTMKTNLRALLALLLCGAAACAGTPAQDGFTPLFNGKDLTGWGYKNGEKFDGKTESSDARYTAKDGMIVVNPGKGIAQ